MLLNTISPPRVNAPTEVFYFYEQINCKRTDGVRHQIIQSV